MGLWSRIKQWIGISGDDSPATADSWTYVAPRFESEAESRRQNFDYAVAAIVNTKGKSREYRDTKDIPKESHLHSADRVIVAMKPINSDKLNYITLYGPFEDYDDLELAIDELLEQEY